MKPIWLKIPAPFLRTMLTSHSALGLFVAALVYLICLTGTIAVFADELRRWETPREPEVASLSSDAVQRAAQAALAAAPPGAIESLSLFLPTREMPRAGVSVSTDKDARDWGITTTGDLTPSRPTDWTDFVAALHMNLNMPGLIGYFVVGLAGVAMIALALSGLLAHPRIFRDAFTLRWGGSARLQEADLHNRLSVWSLPFNFAVSLTGAYFGLISALLYLVAAIGFHGDMSKLTAPMAPPAIAEDATPAPLPAFGALIARVRADELHAEPFSISVTHPGSRGQAITIYATTPRHLRYGEQYYVSPDGTLGRVGFAEGDLGQRLYGAAYPLHFGSFGGLPVKLLYGALGLALCVITASGVNVWLARRRDQNRPAPIAARLWAVTVWGAPIAIIVAALACMVSALPPLAMFWLTLFSCFIAAATRIDGKIWRVACGLGLTALGGLHLALYATRGAPLASIIDAALCLAGFIMVAPMRPRVTRKEA